MDPLRETIFPLTVLEDNFGWDINIHPNKISKSNVFYGK
jgi:hypothetical protein